MRDLVRPLNAWRAASDARRGLRRLDLDLGRNRSMAADRGRPLHALVHWFAP